MTNNITTTNEKTTMTAAEILEALNNEKNTDNVPKLAAALDEAVKADNAKIVHGAVMDFVRAAEQDKSVFFRSFITNPYVTIQRVKMNKETGKRELSDGKRQISFSEIEKEYGKNHDGESLAQAKRYIGMIARFTHNLHANLCGALSEDAGDAGIVKVETYNGVDVNIKEYDFTGNSITKLHEQLNAIVSTILPQDMELKMVKADVRAIMAAHQTEKFMEFTTAAEKKVMNQIFGAMRVRMTGKAYSVTSKALCHKKKNKRSEKQEEKTSRIPDRPGSKEMLSKKAG